LRAIYYKAINTGIIKQENNPFFIFKLKTGKPERVRLTAAEIDLIENLDLPEGQLIWHVRNAFMFSFFCAGIRVSDILMMKWSNVSNGRLEYEMYKTKMRHSVKLVDKARKILHFYKKENSEDYIFPFFNSEIDYSDDQFLFNQLSSKTTILNKYLKEIAQKAGINKKISTHTARHTFADLARQKDINLYNISKTLGHSKLNVTENYLASFDEKAVDDTMDEIFK
jgi:integrase